MGISYPEEKAKSESFVVTDRQIVGKPHGMLYGFLEFVQHFRICVAFRDGVLDYGAGDGVGAFAYASQLRANRAFPYVTGC